MRQAPCTKPRCYRVSKAQDFRPNDVGGRLSRCREGRAAIDQHHRRLGLCSGEAQPQSSFAGEKGAAAINRGSPRTPRRQAAADRARGQGREALPLVRLPG